MALGELMCIFFGMCIHKNIFKPPVYLLSQARSKREQWGDEQQKCLSPVQRRSKLPLGNLS